MPPSASLPLSGTDAGLWPRSDHYSALYQAIESLLDRDYSGIAYDDLPACLAD
jgi:hypothetical protein